MRFKILKYWKQGLVFLNSFLLAFQPAVYALSVDSKGQLKNFVESSEITKREVSLKELYEKYSSELPPDVRSEMKALITEHPELTFPQVNISKIKGENGEEDVQLQFVKDKIAGVITIVGRGKVFAKVGNSVITFDDMIHTEKALAKFAQEFPDPHGVRNPAENKQTSTVQFLKWKQVSKFSPKERDAYLRKYAEALTAAEEVQNTRLNHSEMSADQVLNNLDGTFESFDKYQAFLEVFVPRAGAEDNTPADGVAAIGAGLRAKQECIYAGNLMDYGCRNKVTGSDPTCKKSGGLVCGGYGSSSAQLMSNNSDSGRGCTVDGGGKGVKCFEPLYGKKCVARDNHATKSCGDDPQIYKCETPEQFKKFESEVKKPLEKQLSWCNKMDSDSPKRLLPDQKEACGVLRKKIDIINDTSSCVKAATTPAKEKDCMKDTIGGPTVVTPVGIRPEVGTGPQTADGGNAGKCTEKEWYKDESKYKRGECSKNGAVVNCESDKNYWKCDCGPAKQGETNFYADVPGGPAYSCTAKVAVSDSGTGGREKKVKEDKCAGVMGWLSCNKSWLIPLGLVAGVGYMMYQSQKASLDSYYNYATPAKTATPISTDTTTYKGSR